MITRKDKACVTVIGASVMDVLARPVDFDLLHAGSQPMQDIRVSYGGDALNEAAVLTKLGISVDLISKVGRDEAGGNMLNYMKKLGISVEHVIIDDKTDSPVNIVLVDSQGERFFLTDPKSCLRRLTEEDVMRHLDEAADIVSFASIFVSPLLPADALERIFQRIKEKPGRILAADMTKAKNGEQLETLAGILPYVDYLFPNEEEICLLTGCSDPFENASRLVDMGVRTAVIKLGEKGCLIRTKKACMQIPAYPVDHAVDTTGAGDTFAAGFLYGLSQNLSLHECACMASAAASLAVEHVGAATGINGIDEVKRRMKQLSVRHP